jgi:hypothetical protein
LMTHWHNGSLPSALLTFLRSPQVRKIGVKVSADMKRLYENCQFNNGEQPFVGAVNLGNLAKDRNVTAKASASLVDLTATVLWRFLPKDPTIRVSTAWDSRELSQEQIDYASLDVYAMWSVYQALVAMPTGGKVSESTPGGVAIALLSSDQSLIVAYGHVTPDRPKKYLGMNVTKTKALMTVTNILIPGHIVPGDTLPSRVDTPFTEFPAPPFILLCKTKHLRIQTNENASSAPPSIPESLPAPIIPSSSSCSVSVSHPDSFSPSSSANPITAPTEEISDGMSRWYEDAEATDTPEQTVSTSSADPIGLRQANLLSNELPGAGTADILCSRVLGDIWHLMDQFPISMHHGLRRPFARAL